jgi:tetratricopeptide (TPR) repeat protein
MKLYEKALQIFDQLKNIAGKATILYNIGSIYDAQGNYSKALKWYEVSLQIDEQLGNLSGKASSLNKIGAIYDAQGKYPEALKKLEEALEIFTRLGLSESPNAKNIKKDIEILKSKSPQN